MSIIKVTDLSFLRGKNLEKKIIFCSGSFDLTHVGHVLFFEDCKKRGDILIVSVGGDKIIKDLKGNFRPILNQDIRMKMVDSIKPVDFVFLDEITTIEDPHEMFKFVFKNLKPDEYVINEDVSDIEKRKKLAKSFGIKMKILNRDCPKEFNFVSTTKIIDCILKGNNL